MIDNEIGVLDNMGFNSNDTMTQIYIAFCLWAVVPLKQLPSFDRNNIFDELFISFIKITVENNKDW